MGELTGVERRALDAIDQSAMVAELAELVAIPSITGTDAEADAQAWVARRLDGLGLEVDSWAMDLEALAATDGFPGVEAARTQAWGLVGSMPVRDGTVGDGSTLVLQGHVDVVPARGEWSHEPFAGDIDSMRIYDRVLTHEERDALFREGGWH